MSGIFTGSQAEDRLDPRLKKDMESSPQSRTETTLIEQLKTDLKIAMKAADFPKRNLIRVVLSEIDKAEKMPGAKKSTDSDVIGIMRKLYKGMEETCSLDIPDDKRKEVEVEMGLLDAYLPQLMSENDVIKNVESIIAELGVDSMKGMGQVMREFNKKFPGKADNKLVSQIVKEKLT